MLKAQDFVFMSNVYSGGQGDFKEVLWGKRQKRFQNLLNLIVKA